jgi:hypothetical protein
MENEPTTWKHYTNTLMEARLRREGRIRIDFEWEKTYTCRLCGWVQVREDSLAELPGRIKYFTGKLGMFAGKGVLTVMDNGIKKSFRFGSRVGLK